MNSSDVLGNLEIVSLDASDRYKIRRKIVRNSIFFALLSLFPICLILHTIADESFRQAFFSFDGIFYHVFFWLLPCSIMYGNYSTIFDGLKFLKQGEKMIRRVTITSKEDEIYRGKSTRHYYNVHSNVGIIEIKDAYFGKSTYNVFDELLVGSAVDLIYSLDGKILLDIKVADERARIQNDDKNKGGISLFELVEEKELSAEDKNVLSTVYKRHVFEHTIQLVMFSLLALPITIFAIKGEFGDDGIYLILFFDGPLFLYFSFISRKYWRDMIRKKKSVYITFVRDKIHRKRDGAIFNNTPFTNQDNDFYVILTPMMEFYVPEKLFNKLDGGESIRIEICKSSKTLLAVSQL